MRYRPIPDHSVTMAPKRSSESSRAAVLRPESSDGAGTLDALLAEAPGIPEPLRQQLLAAREAERRQQQQDSARNSEQVQLALSAARFGVCHWDLATGHLKWSPEHFEILGYEPNTFEPLYSHWRERIHPDDLQAVEAEIEAAKAERRPVSKVFRVVRPEGGMRWVEASGRFTYDPQGEAISLSGLLLDVTATRLAEEELKLSEERFAIAFRASPDAMAISRLDGRLIEVNQTWERMFGWSREEAIGKSPLELNCYVNAEDRERFRKSLEQRSNVRNFSVLVRRRSGDVFLAEMSAELTSIRGETCYLTNLRDVTERQGMEDAVRRSERLYRAIGETIDFGIWVCDPEGNNIYLSDSFLKLTGLTQEQASQHGWFTALHPDDVASTMAAWRACIQLGGSWDREHRIRGVDGKYHPVLARGVPVRDENGQIEFWAGINLDISRMKRFEEQLRESERRLQAVIDNAGAMIYVKDRRGRYVLVNRRFEDAFQVTRNEVFGKTDFHLFPQELAESFAANDRRVLESGQPLEVEEVASLTTGSRSYISVKFPLRHADGEIYAVCGISTDITARKQMESALRDSEERFRRIVETANEGIWLLGPMGETTFANHRMAEILGCKSGDMAGTRLQDYVFEEDLPAAELLLQRNLQGYADQIDFRFRRLDGAEVLVLGCTSPVENESGHVVGALGMFSDITDRRRAEDALKEADRRKDEFLAMLAHELRNPLAAISSAHELSKLDGLAQQEQRWAGEVIGRQVSQLTAIIDDLLDVSRITRGKIQLKRKRVRFDEIASRAAATLKPLVDQHRHQLEVTLPDQPIWVDGDPNRLEQVLVNMLNNACKYTPDGGRIELSLSCSLTTATTIVRDSGVGITPEMLPRIFDLFAQADHSLDRSKGGLGIGLTLVQKLVEMHGGQIGAHSDGLGRGSSFTIELPLAPEPEKAPDEANRASDQPSVCRVLLVDDNADAAHALALVLQAAGHTVITAHEGQAAIQQALHSKPHAILLDIGLPHMDGYEVARRIRREPQFAETLMVAISGYGQSEDRQRSTESGFDHHLVKPIRHDELLALLASVQLQETS